MTHKVREIRVPVTFTAAANVTAKTGAINGVINAIGINYSGDLTTALAGGGLDVVATEDGGVAREIMNRTNQTATFSHLPSLASQLADGTPAGEQIVGVGARSVNFVFSLNAGGNLPAVANAIELVVVVHN